MLRSSSRVPRKGKRGGREIPLFNCRRKKERRRRLLYFNSGLSPVGTSWGEEKENMRGSLLLGRGTGEKEKEGKGGGFLGLPTEKGQKKGENLRRGGKGAPV